MAPSSTATTRLVVCCHIVVNPITQHGLLRVGTGQQGTIRGHVYASHLKFNQEDESSKASNGSSKADPAAEEKRMGALVFLHGRLFFASPAAYFSQQAAAAAPSKV